MSSHPTLFDPVTLGDLRLRTRVVMAPMTRNRARADGVPTPRMAVYYAQRASAGLIVSEMTIVAADGRAYADTPGLHDAAQAAGWRRVTDAVHAAGGRIVAQLAHGGRISHPSLLPDGRRPVAPSAITPAGEVLTREGWRPFEEPRALTAREIGEIVGAFAGAAAWARLAGFDGVELHAANGYLLDQFLRDGTNRRTDAWGGSVARRQRLLLDVLRAVADVWGAGRVGVRISPWNPYNDMSDSDPATTFTALAATLGRLAPAYLHVVEAPDGDGAPAHRILPELKRRFGGPLIANGGLDRARAERLLARGEADAASFGASFLANPDLPARLALGAPLNPPDRTTFYAGAARGYTDYPVLADDAPHASAA